jgi:YD repeat-containing protein
MYTPSTSGPIELNFHDDYYPDNSEYPNNQNPLADYPLQVEIYRALPSTPGDLTATPVHAGKQVNLSWTNTGSVGASGSTIVVERELPSATAWTTIATLPAGSISYTDTPGAYNQEYLYQVYVQNSFGQSAPSNTAYATVVNLPPQIAAITPQVAYIGTPFQYRIIATDPQDGKTGLTYSITNGPSEPNGNIMKIESTGLIDGWTPTTGDAGFSWNPVITVTDAEGSSTNIAMNVSVAPPLSTIPSASVAAHVVAQSPTTVTLAVTGTDAANGADISYTWETISQPGSAGIPTFSVNGTNGASQTVATVYGAGNYLFKVLMDNGDGWPGSSQTPVVTIGQTPTTIGVTPVSTEAVADSQTPTQLAAQEFDQFGQPMATQPTFTWSIAGGSAGGCVNSSTGAYTPPGSVPANTTPSAVIDAVANGVTGTAVITVPATPPLAPVITISDTNPNAIADDFSHLELTVSATDPNNPGTDSNLIYTWTAAAYGAAAGAPPVSFGVNGTNAAKTTTATCSGQYPLDYTFTIMVTDNYGLSASTTLTISDVRNLTQIAVTPQNDSVGEGVPVQFAAVGEDQYGRPVVTQPTIDWNVYLDGNTTAISSGTGANFTYTPTSAGEYSIEAETADGSVSANSNLDVVAPGPPTMQIVSPGAASGATPPEISAATPIDIISDNPDGTPSPWSLWLFPPNATTSTPGIRLASSNQSIGQPGNAAQAAMLDPAAYANGVYTLELEDGSGTVQDTKLVSIYSTIKLGNLTLPITDLTVNVPGTQPITVTRNYDSSQADVNGSLGYGWQLNTAGTQFSTTVEPGIADGDPTNGFADGDLVYITLPNGQQHVFEFVAQYDPNEVGTLEGYIQSIAYYTPNFVCVDGSGATLSVAQNIVGTGVNTSYNGDPILLEQQNGYYIDSATGQNYNPADPLFAGSANNTPNLDPYDYTLRTSDGTAYVVNPTNGNLVSVADPNGNITNYSSLSNYVSETTDSPSNGQQQHITSISDGAGQTVQYAYDSDGNLIGVINPTGGKTSYQYADELLVPYNGSSGTNVYATITNSTTNQVWNNASAGGGWTSGNPLTYAITLTGDTDADSSAEHQWYYLDAPAIASGTGVTIKYYVRSGGTPSSGDQMIWSETRTWNNDAAHEMTAIIDPGGVKVLTAGYEAGSGELASLTQTDQPSSPVKTGGFDGTSDDQTVTNSAGDTTEDIYDAYGNVIRQIKTMTDSNGNITGYQVTVSQYQYVTADTNNPQDTGVSLINTPESVIEYAPFEVLGTDSAGLRYSESAPVMQQFTSYYCDPSDSPSDIGEPSSETTYLPNGQTQVTKYSDYILGKPTTVTEQIETNSGVDIGPPVTTSSAYDSDGNLTSSTDATGITTYYDYSNDNRSDVNGTGIETSAQIAGLPGGLLLDSFKLLDGVPSSDVTIAADRIPLSENIYFTSTAAAAGAYAGMLESTTTYNGANSQTTEYAYDSLGNQILSYTPKTWSTSNGSTVTGWTATITQYNLAGQSTDTWQGAYVGTGTFSYSVSAPSSTSTGVVTVNEHLYVDSSQTSPATAPPLHTSHTDYNASGQVTDTTDQYGAVTTSVYDINGNVIDTLYPDGTEIRTVYNSLGQVLLQTNRYKTNTSINTATGVITYDNTTIAPLATVTLYNSLGQAFSTQEYKNVLVTITADPSAPAGSGIEMAATSTGLTPQSSNFISSTQTWFDEQGRVIETRDAAGLRTGTIYNSDGSVAFTGPLNSSAPDGGELNSAGNGYAFTAPVIGGSHGDFASYTAYLYNQVDTSTGNPWSGMVYNSVIDANGHATETFEDSSGRVIFTVYANGSFTQTVYSQGDQPISGYTVIPAGSTTSVLPTIPAGGSETIQFAQRKLSDPAVYTIDIYDAAGNLVNVWEPAVADPAHSNQSTNPEWIYAYDASGNEISQTDPNGNVTQFAYDENGNKVSETLPDGEMQTWTYDAFGNNILHKVYSATNHATALQTTWDILDTSNDGFGGQLQAEYRYSSDFTPNPPSNESVLTYANGTSYAEKTLYTYDSLGRHSSVTDYTQSGSTVTQTFSTSYAYDPITGNQASIATTEGTTPAGTINYTYNDATGQLQETSTGSNDEFYFFNSLGQLQDVDTLELNGTRYATFTGFNSSGLPSISDGTPLVTAYTYDPVGNLQSVTDPNGMVTQYSYNPLNQLTDESVTDGTANLFTEHYDYGDNGLKKDEIDTRYVVNSTTVASTTTVDWTYDNEGKLLTESSSTAGGASSLDYVDSFAYDLDNNRLSETITGGTTGNGSINYAYNGDDQVTTETGTYTNTANDYQTLYTYDTNGNLHTQVRTGAGAVSDTYTYDLRNRMTVDATTTGSSTTYTDYSYDSNGVLVSETTNAGTSSAATTYYLNDPNNLTGYTKAIQESTTLGGAPTRSYMLGTALIAQSDTTRGVLYFLNDGHGSTRALVNGSGAVVSGQVYDYDAFGDALDFNAATADTPWLFGGDGFYDPASGWTYQLARWRNGFWFTTMDAGIGGPNGSNSDPISLHKYLYAGADPVNNYDPSGHDLLGLVLSVAGELAFDVAMFSTTYAPAIASATTIAGAVFLVSGVELALEQTGFLPQNDYTPYIFAISGALFTAGQSLQALNANTVQITSPLRDSSDGKLINGITANAMAGTPLPPYVPDSLAAEGTISPSTQLVRFYSPGTSGMVGQWCAEESEVQGLTAAQIQAKLALPALPTRVVDVQAAGQAARTGIAGPNFGQPGGGPQVQLLPPYGAKFVNDRPLPPGGL